MEMPFLFGKTVKEDTFTNRRGDVQRLTGNLENHVNTILISPRRWGKSSLVKKVVDGLLKKGYKIVQLDLFGVRSEEEFYKLLTAETIKATSGKLEEWVGAGKEFFKHLTPKISVGVDPLHDFEVSFDRAEVSKHYREALNLPQEIARKKKLKLIVCVDEFQNCATFKDPVLFQKRLRAEWQHHHDVTYCLFGSRQHMMMSLFERQSMPFYKFGDVMYLPKISRTDWVEYIRRQFTATKKSISIKLAEQIAAAVEDHSYYVQQLSSIVWFSTKRTVTQSILDAAVSTLLDQNSILYTREIEGLSGVQHNFLKAVASGIHKGLSSKDVVGLYQLGTSANVQKIKKVLLQKELIDETANGIFFLDPVFRLWFRREVLKKREL